MDLTTAEYSFVIKCPASRHLPVRRKNSSALQGRWLEEPEGFPTHVSFRKANKRVVTTPQGKQKGIMAAARRTEGALRPRGCEPPSAPSGSSPCEAGQFFPSGFDCRHSGLCITQFLQFVFPDGVTPPQECGLFRHYPVRGGMNPFRAGKINYFREVLYWQP